MTDTSPEPAWWNTFFGGNWLEVSRGMKAEEATELDCDFVRGALDIKAGQKVLDVPCGDGRLSIPLATAGCPVVGIDLQPRLIETANIEAARLKVPFEGRVGDMRDLPWFDEFDAAVCFWTSFGYFDADDDRAFLEAVWRSLKPGAPFLIETMTIETVLPGFLEKDWFEAGDWTVMEERRFDHETSRLHGAWTFVRDGEIQKKSVSVRLRTYNELTALLDRVGFGDFVAYDAPGDSPFSMDSSRLGLVARKES